MRALRKVFKNFFKEKNKLISNTNKISYSQCGEDLIVDYIFKLRGISKPSYIDVGANDPYFLNNTAIFYLRGCRGINIDANESCINKFFSVRPEDINLNIGIGNKKSVKELYIMNDSTLSTFSESECQKYIATGKYELVEKKQIDILRLDDVLKEYNNGVFPDFMSLDVEGLDYEIIKSINFDNSTPKIICVEAAEYSPIGAGARRHDIIDFLKEKGYYEYANTNLNAIMVKKEFWFI